MDLKTDYFLLLIDIKDSTFVPVEEMNTKFSQLEDALKILNFELKGDLILPMNISYGDEISGLFNSPESFYDIIALIRKTLYPLTTIRFAAVKGKIGRISSDIRKIGGKIFKDASKSIDYLKKNHHFCSWQISDDTTDKTLAILCEISNLMIESMSEYQRKVFELLHDGLSQKEISEKLGKHKQSVWSVLQRSNAVFVVEAEKAVNLNLLKSKSK